MTYRVRYELKCKTRDSYGRFTGICVVDWTHSAESAVDLLFDACSSYNNHCYDHWIDTVLEKI